MVMNVLDAAYNVGEDYKDGGTAGLARRMSRNPTTLTHELGRVGTAKLGLLDAVKMSVLTGDLRILQAFAGACGQMLVPLPMGAQGNLSTDECIECLGEASQQFGELTREICVDLADNEVNANELERFHKLKGRLYAVIDHLDRAMTSKCEADTQRAANRFGPQEPRQ